MKPQYPDVEILEVLEATYGYYQVDSGTCQSWVYKNGLTHPVLRDPAGQGSVASTLGLQVKDMMIVDRWIKIRFKARVVTTFDQNQVLTTLGQLK